MYNTLKRIVYWWKIQIIGITYSVDSTVGVDGIIINIQFVRIVVMMNNENSGWTRILIATRRIGLNGSSNHNASVAEKRKISLLLLTTTKVCIGNEKNKEVISKYHFIKSMTFFSKARGWKSFNKFSMEMPLMY